MPIADSPLEPRRLGREFPTYDASSETASFPVPFPEPTGQLPLRAAFAAALLNSPALAAFSWEVRAREAGAIQAGQLPNPEFSLEVEEFGGGGDRSAFDSADTTVRLGQVFELGGKRAKRQRVATLERDLAAWDYETHLTRCFHRCCQSICRGTCDAEASSPGGRTSGSGRRRPSRPSPSQVELGAVSPAEESRARVGVSQKPS